MDGPYLSKNDDEEHCFLKQFGFINIFNINFFNINWENFVFQSWILQLQLMLCKITSKINSNFALSISTVVHIEKE